eukprot:TRINITY_DN12819_c0_g1_i1.p1 TRINITY_DN12819_c0_g1~~TRINITY_DN12819_c0_g1_i1.p1  ORF type:complete len:260 (+),score=5.80 TRINITY_DN12819_c0_g1_i1:396-1175(+)
MWRDRFISQFISSFFWVNFQMIKKASQFFLRCQFLLYIQASLKQYNKINSLWNSFQIEVEKKNIIIKICGLFVFWCGFLLARIILYCTAACLYFQTGWDTYYRIFNACIIRGLLYFFKMVQRLKYTNVSEYIPIFIFVRIQKNVNSSGIIPTYQIIMSIQKQQYWVTLIPNQLVIIYLVQTNCFSWGILNFENGEFDSGDDIIVLKCVVVLQDILQIFSRYQHFDRNANKLHVFSNISAMHQYSSEDATYVQEVHVVHV